MPLCLAELPADVVRHISDCAGVKAAAQLHATRRDLWRHHQQTTCGVSLAGLTPSLSTTEVYTRFGKDVRPLLTTVKFQKAGNARRYAAADVLVALLRAYGGWAGLRVHLDAPAQRAAAVAEKEQLAFRRAVVQLEEFVASSRRIPFDSFFAWLEASSAARLRSPAERPETRAFLTGTPKRPPFSRVRRELELYAALQERCKERRATLHAALKPYDLSEMSEEAAYRAFCDGGEEADAPRVARELARRRGVAL